MDLDAFRDGPLADVADPAPVISRETVYAGRVWDVVSDTVEFAGGSMTRDYVVHSGAVAVLALDDDDRVLLINQYRQPIGTRDWEIPAGLLDVAGEEPLDAARRELAEETDFAAAEWERLLSVHTTPGATNEVIHFFIARGITSIAEAHVREEEESEIVVRWAPLDEVVAAGLDGRIRNGPLLIAVLAAAARRERRDD